MHPFNIKYRKKNRLSVKYEVHAVKRHWLHLDNYLIKYNRDFLIL